MEPPIYNPITNAQLTQYPTSADNSSPDPLCGGQPEAVFAPPPSDKIKPGYILEEDFDKCFFFLPIKCGLNALGFLSFFNIPTYIIYYTMISQIEKTHENGEFARFVPKQNGVQEIKMPDYIWVLFIVALACCLAQCVRWFQFWCMADSEQSRDKAIQALGVGLAALTLTTVGQIQYFSWVIDHYKCSYDMESYYKTLINDEIFLSVVKFIGFIYFISVARRYKVIWLV